MTVHEDLFFYAWHDFVKKPKQFSALICVNVLVMLSVSFYLIFMQCQNLLETMPDDPDNYHIALHYLTEAQADKVAARKEILYSYKSYIEVYKGYNEREDVLELRLRFKPEYAPTAGKIVREILFDTGLINLPEYSNYRYNLKMYGDIYNYDYVLKTTTPFILLPSTIIVISLFSLFLGSSVILLFHEKYERSVREYGTLRAIGMTKPDIVIINLIETALVQLVSMLPAFLLSLVSFRVFTMLSSSLTDEIVSTFVNNIPIATIFVVMIAVSVGALGGSCVTCALSYNRSVIGLIHGEQQQVIAFVSETDKRIDTASSPRIYTRLYIMRMRMRELLNAISVAVTLPLPLYFILISAVTASLSTETTLKTYFIIFTAVMLSLASLVLTAATNCYHIMWRKREFAKLRLIGASKACIYSLVTPGCLFSAVLCALPGSIFSILMYDSIYFAEAPIIKSWAAIPNTQHYTIQSLIILITYCIIASLTIIVIPALTGTLFTLKHSMKRSITDSIREIE